MLHTSASGCCRYRITSMSSLSFTSTACVARSTLVQCQVFDTDLLGLVTYCKAPIMRSIEEQSFSPMKLQSHYDGSSRLCLPTSFSKPERARHTDQKRGGIRRAPEDITSKIMSSSPNIRGFGSEYWTTYGIGLRDGTTSKPGTKN